MRGVALYLLLFSFRHMETFYSHSPTRLTCTRSMESSSRLLAYKNRTSQELQVLLLYFYQFGIQCIIPVAQTEEQRLPIPSSVNTCHYLSSLYASCYYPNRSPCMGTQCTLSCIIINIIMPIVLLSRTMCIIFIFIIQILM